MKIKTLFAIIITLFISSESLPTTKAVPPQKPTIANKIKPAVPIRKKRHPKRRLKYVAPPQGELKVEAIPLTLKIPEEFTTALANNDLEGAVRILRIEPPSSRSLYLIREAQKIISYNKKDRKVPKIDKHKFYQNLGIAHHNLFLFLKRQGMTNEKLYKSALKFYTKASHSSRSIPEKTECKLLSAAIKASKGLFPAAEKTFAKLDINLLSDSYEGLEYIAAYYAATGIVDKTIDYLSLAYEIHPEQVSIWLAIGDDFFKIENDPKFQKFIPRVPQPVKKKGPSLHIPQRQPLKLNK